MLFNQIISSVTPGQGRGTSFVSLRTSLARGARNETSVATTKLQNTIGWAAGSSPKLLGGYNLQIGGLLEKERKTTEFYPGGDKRVTIIRTGGWRVVAVASWQPQENGIVAGRSTLVDPVYWIP